jgi:phenylalanyl-tRNA synthetase beta chain
MKLPLAWLRDYLALDVPLDTLVEKLALLGFPVESVEVRPVLRGVVAGRILACEKHPNADRLSICTIDAGGPQTLAIATAATNVAAGQTIPVATIGAQLVGEGGAPLAIAPRKMRGIDSQGMLCSAAELGLPAEWFEDGIMQLEADVAPGTDVLALYRLAEPVIEVEIGSNRADAMCMLGLARELGAAFDLPVREPETSVSILASDTQPDIRITLESRDCRRFVAQRFSDVAVRPAPAWMRVRLALAGQRPISNLVDISNFVMLELGQPQHFYDYDKLAGHHLIARDARPGETVRTLDGELRALTPAILVIADENEAQCIAGLMGAAASEVTATTRELVVESAKFHGPRIRRGGVATALRSEASSRHEKHLAVGLADRAAARAAHLLAAEGARVHAPVAAGEAPPVPAPIVVEAGRIASVLGFAPEAPAVERALRSLGFEVRVDAAGDAPRYAVVPPYWRTDVAIPVDVIEEIGRIIGYDKIEAVAPPVLDQTIASTEYDKDRSIAHELRTLGYREAIPFALTSRAAAARFERAGYPVPPLVELQNPLSEDQRYLRFSLLPALLALAARYESDEPLRYFTLGHVFAEGEAPLETPMVAWLLATPRRDEPAWRDSEFLRFKGESLAFARALTGLDPDVAKAHVPGLHPGKSASVLVGGREIAQIGALDPRLAAAYELTSSIYVGLARTADIPSHRLQAYRAPSRFPGVARDLAIVVPAAVSAGNVEHVARTSGDGVLRSVQVFDEYRGAQVAEGHKSLALHLLLQREAATLTDAEADAYVATIFAALRERCGAQLRA